ncbi:MAG: biopolymer transporter ExbD [Gammaproteobacteria bacterium]|nr:biopolymer transporter ExbD [Gammaproteobacteria bacterium]NNC97966.1 biopolymer transporter ExbD [Gammaproteobacteria bacterium]NNM13771.1 biopolymer transporter ExbD [Gammaproteobacteria bacterium]
MRKFGNRALEEETEIDITPMLDVVFIMLIFFIVTATFVKQSGTEVDKPLAVTAEQKARANILIAIDSNDIVWMDGDVIETTAITATVKKLRAENPKGVVMIQADKSSSHKMLLEVMEGAKAAGAEEIAISTETS